MDLMLFLHILGGGIALSSGAAALLATKGSQLHKKAGTVFFIAMLIMSGFGAIIAYLKYIMSSAVIGAITFYLTATAWKTVQRRPGEVGHFERIAMGGAVLISFAGFYYGIAVANGDPNIQGGIAPGFYYFFSSVAAFAVLMDARMLIIGGLNPAQRLMRHIWRMCFTLLTATASFFAGQAKLLPEIMRETQTYLVPILLVLLAMIFWVGKTLWQNKLKAI